MSLTGMAVAGAPGSPEPQRALVQSHVDRARAAGLERLPVGDRVAALGRQFLGAPYVPGVLESPDRRERLVVDLDRLDCVTFVETVLALARVLPTPGGPAFEAFCRELQALRYRGGAVDGFASRLHYTVDHLAENVRTGRLADVTATVGGAAVQRDLRPLDFISRHREAYPALTAEALPGIRAVEAAHHGFDFIPKAAVAVVEGAIEPGDVVAVTTDVPGLDCSHVGFALRGSDGRIHLLHASQQERRVVITAEPLADYLARHPHQTGIILARPRP